MLIVHTKLIMLANENLSIPTKSKFASYFHNTKLLYFNRNWKLAIRK